jgi:hypothetical protein
VNLANYLILNQDQVRLSDSVRLIELRTTTCCRYGALLRRLKQGAQLKLFANGEPPVPGEVRERA